MECHFVHSKNRIGPKGTSIIIWVNSVYSYSRIVLYCMQVLTHLPCHFRVTYSPLSLSIPAVGRFFFSRLGNLWSGAKVAAGKFYLQ